MAGVLRTYFGLWSQEMGGLKPGAGSALVKAAPAMAGTPWETVLADGKPVGTGSAVKEQTWHAMHVLQCAPA